MPKVSIIVPVYNVEKYLTTCLDSILAQTYIDWEAILVDDGSTDKSGTICDEYAKKDNRFIVVHKPNEGVAKARITAFEHSKGELITFIDADDYVSNVYLEKLSKPILEDDADMVSCNFYDVSLVNNQITSSKRVMVGTFCGNELSDFIANHYFYDKSCRGFGMTNFLCTKMVKRAYVHEGLTKGIGMWFGEDQVSMFSMLYRINSLCLLSDRLYYYVHYKTQATQRYNPSLWDSLIRMFETYQKLDTKHITQKGLRIRTWLYVFRTIHNKMFPSGISRDEFVSQLAYVRRQAYMQEFYHPLSIRFGWRDELRYWLLKLNMLRIYYKIYTRKK